MEQIEPSWVSGSVDFDPEEIVVAAVMRDEALRLPAFLQHYRSLGAHRFIIIDNGSTDETLSSVEGVKDVTLFQAGASYRDSGCGVDWINAVLSSALHGNWVVVADADELLVYPRSETVPLARLTGYLGTAGATAMIAPLIDMYSDGPISDVGYRRGESLVATCPLFDVDTYQYRKIEDGLSVVARGGPRDRLFWQGRNRPSPPPFLFKVPLLRWNPQAALRTSTHQVVGVRPSRLTGALLHFKMLQDFPSTVRREADREQHFENGAQYKFYDEIMSANPHISACFENSVRYRDSMQLVELGIMNMPAGFESHLNTQSDNGWRAAQPEKNASSAPPGRLIEPTGTDR